MICDMISACGVVLSLIAAIITLSAVSLGFIVHLTLKTRTCRSHHLTRFNSLWAVRSTLVLTISLWALSHLLRARHVITSTPLLCKLHVALSLGFFQPAFLVTLLFLLHVSVPENDKSSSSSPPSTPLSSNNSNGRRALASVIATCSPILCVQILVLFFFSRDVAGFINLPPYFWRTEYEVGNNVSSEEGQRGNSTVFCTYPLLSTVVFGSFAFGYCFVFFFSAWRVVSFVINKALRLRIYGLVVAVLVSLTAQVLFLGLSELFTSNEPAYDVMALVVFLSTFACAAVGEGILVIKPIVDSLAVWGDCCLWDQWRGSTVEIGRA